MWRREIFKHVANLRYNTEQVTASLIYTICNQDDKCDLTSSFQQKVHAPILQALHAVVVAEELITLVQLM